MSTVARYNERVSFQRYLDELFPEGARIAVVDRSLGRPTGIEMVVGRVFCAGVQVWDEDWIHDLLMDPRIRASTEEDPTDYVRPLRAWIVDFVEVEDDTVYEAEIVSPVEPETGGDILRARSRLEGPHRAAPGSREFVTEKWEGQLFPHGLRELQMEAL